MAAMGVGTSLLSAAHNNAVAKANIDRARQGATYRAADRRQALRESVAAMRVASVGQGTAFGSASTQNLVDVGIRNFMSDSERDAFQTAGEIQSAKNARITGILNALAGGSRSLLSYERTSRETLGGAAGTAPYVPHRADGKH
jgi:hypothetical protein